MVVSSRGQGSATPAVDFLDLQSSRTVIFPPFVYKTSLFFNISDDIVPEIAESFHLILLEESVRGDAVLVPPNAVQVTIEPNDKPNGVLSISSSAAIQPIIINEDLIQRLDNLQMFTLLTNVLLLQWYNMSVLIKTIVYLTVLNHLPRFEGIVIVRNGGSYGAVSANWSISRNSSDRSPVSDDLKPAEGTVRFAAGQVTAVIPINIVADDLPEEAEAFVFKLLNNTSTGNAEVDEPTEVSLEETFDRPTINHYLTYCNCRFVFKGEMIEEGCT